MLDFMRNQAQSWIVKVLFGVIVLSFALWGVGDYFSGESAVTVAEVGDETIHQRPFKRRVQQQRQRLQDRLGTEMGGRISEQPQFQQRILRGMIRERLLAQEVARLGLTASDRTVARQVQQQPAFQRGGEFSAEKYQQTLSRIGQTPAKFEAGLRRDLAARQLRRLVSEASVITDQDLARSYQVRNERRTVQYVAFSPDGFRDAVTVDDEAVQAYYESHQDRYQRPARARVRWLELSPETFGQSRPDEEALRAFYADNRDSFAEPEERKARHILIRVPEDAGDDKVAEVRQRAKELANKARQGGDFAELARQHSQGPSASAGGDVGWFGKGDMVAAFEERAFALEPGTVSDPVRSRFGFHVIRVEDVRGGEAPAFGEVRDRVAEKWRQERGAERIFDRLPDFKDLLYTRDSLKPAAEELGLEIRGPAWVSAAGGMPEGLPDSQKLREAALNTQPGRNTQALEVSSTRFIGLHVAEQQPAKTKPLEAVRDQVVADYRRQQARKRAREAARKLAEAAKAGSLAGAAESGSRPVQKAGPLGRQQARQDLPNGLSGAVFAAKLGEPRTASLPDGGMAVLEVTDRQRPDPATMTASDRRNLTQQLRDNRGRARLEGYLDHLRQRYKVRIRRDVLSGSG